ncbi:Keratin, type I cytoskeletal 18 [Characodon lateralis]|uniref:Keratin, type I cytoskeletal 18 n=1 Tax=Characodon lateralis TaxID=208331 RepID=A0ABU7CXI6_9TELE|nr:Keratin, type I cytoskeletal 18 [Characodon lateralis]
MEPPIRRQSSQNLGFSSYSSSPTAVYRGYAHSVSGGAGGRGTRMSTVLHGTRVGAGFSGGYDYQSSGTTSGTLAIGNEKVAMQHLNDRLASYLETVRNLEKANTSLEIKIREAIEKRGPLEGRDYSKYTIIITKLRAKIYDMMKGNARLAIAVDNARLTSDDFRFKMEYEVNLRQTVEADITRFRKLLDDTNVIRLHLEGDIEALKAELITLKKTHEEDVDELRAQITQAGVRVDVDAPKGQDLARIMEEMREKYERMALKNQAELKAWHESQITDVQVQVTDSSTALKDATCVMNEIRRTQQGLEIELQSALSLKAALEATLRNIEMRYNLELEKYNLIILRLQDQLTQIRTDIQQNSREYENLLNVKVKLEAEIAEYRRLLDGGADLKLEDAIEQKKMETKVMTVTQTIVDGKVVSESKDIKSSEHKL